MRITWIQDDGRSGGSDDGAFSFLERTAKQNSDGFIFGIYVMFKCIRSV